MKTPITDMVREQRGDYLTAVEDMEASHAALLKVARAVRAFAESNPYTGLADAHGYPEGKGLRVKLSRAIATGETFEHHIFQGPETGIMSGGG